MRQQMQMMQAHQVIARLQFSYLLVFQMILNAQVIITLLASVR
jgi:hypothetical protein